jgi:hypothetical protein
VQLLDSDVAPQQLIVRPPDHTHPALTDAGEQAVTTGDHSHVMKLRAIMLCGKQLTHRYGI